ncbi:MAG: hypothetical protein JKY65_31080 [Planctomycetes bacterium]|nr:hypothetical protein [Planctomycetota bacterium]
MNAPDPATGNPELDTPRWLRRGALRAGVVFLLLSILLGGPTIAFLSLLNLDPFVS